MSLLNKLRRKYSNPEIEIVELNGEDIITSSGEQAEIEFAKKTKKERETPLKIQI